MTETKEFKAWHRIETMKRSGQMAQIDDMVANEMKKVRVEVKKDGKWVEVNKGDKLDSAE